MISDYTRNTVSGLFHCALLALAVSALRAEDCTFTTLPESVALSMSHCVYLGLTPTALPDGKMLFFIRDKSRKTPGDYFRPPLGADPSLLSDTELSTLDSMLQTFIEPAYFNKVILDSVNGYEYTIGSDSVNRKEYHVAYSCGDTVYVISAWIGNFFSFYRAIPGDFRYDQSELQDEVQKLSPSYRKTRDDSFKRIDEEKNYFLDYVDRENMIRVRNYLVDATFIFEDTRQGKTTQYNLIEITKFIDPEVMP